MQSAAHAPLVGLSVAKAGRRYRPRVLILSLKRGTRVIVTPGPEVTPADGDTLAVSGAVPYLATLEQATAR